MSSPALVWRSVCGENAPGGRRGENCICSAYLQIAKFAKSANRAMVIMAME
jgi:hypothetical protein